MQSSRVYAIRTVRPAHQQVHLQAAYTMHHAYCTYRHTDQRHAKPCQLAHKAKSSAYSSTERRVPELIPVLGSQPAGDVSHKPGSRLPLFSAGHAVTLAKLKRDATNFAAW